MIYNAGQLRSRKPSKAIFNLFIQDSKHYDWFMSSISSLMQLEPDFMSGIVGGRVNTLIDLNRIYNGNIREYLY